jgi:hypothetical protein
MNWWLIGLGALPAIGAAVCLWYRGKIGRERALMAATPTSQAAEVVRLAPGTLVELKGNLRCPSPLSAEFSKQNCAYFFAKIEREEVYYERDSQGRNERKTRSITIHSNIKFAPCTVEDGSGRVALNLDGADIEGEQVVNRREREQGVAGTILSIATGTGGGDLIHTETILALDIPIYVLGEVQADRSVGKPAKGSKNKVFVVSHKSEEERAKDLGSSMLWLLVISIVLVAATAGLVIWGVIKPP